MNTSFPVERIKETHPLLKDISKDDDTVVLGYNISTYRLKLHDSRELVLQVRQLDENECRLHLKSDVLSKDRSIKMKRIYYRALHELITALKEESRVTNNTLLTIPYTRPSQVSEVLTLGFVIPSANFIESPHVTVGILLSRIHSIYFDIDSLQFLASDEMHPDQLQSKGGKSRKKKKRRRSSFRKRC
jgi:hypothetical protein